MKDVCMVKREIDSMTGRQTLPDRALADCERRCRQEQWRAHLLEIRFRQT